MKRRDFIQQTSLVAASTLLAPALLGGHGNLGTSPIGIQLYTLKDVIGKDVKGTLKRLADIGFKDLEAYSYSDGKIFNMPYAEFNNMVKDMGMSVISGHYLTGNAFPAMKGTLVNGWEQAVEDAQKAGQKYMIIAWLHPDERKTLDAYKKTCELMNKANEMCKKAGVTLGYHNHEFEFVPIDGTVPYHLMAAEMDKSICLELDIYWSTFANADWQELFKKYSGRIHLWHVKDMDKAKREVQTDVGSGSIDYKPVFKAANVSGMKHFFLEQEYFTGDQFVSVTNGYKYIKSII